MHDFQEAIDLDPSSSDAYAGRGSARLRLGEHREAVADVEKALGLGEPSGDLCYKAARVYALADVVAGAEVRKKGSETVILAARYQDRAATLLRETFKRTPVAERTSFWRNIQSDPALTAPRGKDVRVLRRTRLADLPVSEVAATLGLGESAAAVAGGRAP